MGNRWRDLRVTRLEPSPVVRPLPTLIPRESPPALAREWHGISGRLICCIDVRLAVLLADELASGSGDTDELGGSS